MARLSRRLWGGTSLKTAAKEANIPREPEVLQIIMLINKKRRK